MADSHVLPPSSNTRSPSAVRASKSMQHGAPVPGTMALPGEVPTSVSTVSGDLSGVSDAAGRNSGMYRSKATPTSADMAGNLAPQRPVGRRGGQALFGGLRPHALQRPQHQPAQSRVLNAPATTQSKTQSLPPQQLQQERSQHQPETSNIPGMPPTQSRQPGTAPGFGPVQYMEQAAGRRPPPLLRPPGMRPPRGTIPIASSVQQPMGLPQPLPLPIPPSIQQPLAQQPTQLSRPPPPLGMPPGSGQTPRPSVQHSIQQRPSPAQQPSQPQPQRPAQSSPAVSGTVPPTFGQRGRGMSPQQQQQQQQQRPLRNGWQMRGNEVLRSDNAESADSRGPRISADQMPRPSTFDGEAKEFATRANGKHQVPPPTEQFIAVRDCGNASPRHMRLTLNYIPNNQRLRKATGLPLAVVIQPLALPGPEDDAIQVADMGEGGPVRCSRCKAYMNCFMTFSDRGTRFTCNLCGASNDTPHDYRCAIDPDGRRLDTYQRPELCCGSVDFVASQEYMVQAPMPPCHMFLIDVSVTAMESGASAAACAAVSQAIQELQGGDRAMCAIATFDSTVHFYALRPGQSAPHMVVMPDVDEPYSPTAASCIVPAEASRTLALQLLESIPRLFAGTCVSETAAGAAISAAVSLLKESSGGKLHVFMSSLPRAGAGALHMRATEGLAAGEKPLTIMAPEGKFYTHLAEEAADHQVAVDVFVMGGSITCEVATVREVAAHTGGTLYHYPSWDPTLDSDLLWNDLRWNVLRPQALEGVARLRVSGGLQVDTYHGAFRSRTAEDIDLPALNADQSVVATLDYDDKLREGQEAYLQFALLYTTTSGARRIRVLNMGVPVTNVLGSVYRGADVESIMNVITRLAAEKLPTTSLPDTRSRIQSHLVKSLAEYRKFCAKNANPGQLILPETLQLMPLYIMVLIKQACFRHETPHDTRAAWLGRLLSLPVPRTLPLLHGRLLPVHQLLAESAALPAGKAGEGPPVPPLKGLGLSSKDIDPEGVYLWENGVGAVLYIGSRAPDDLVTSLLGDAQAPTMMLQKPGYPQRPLPRLPTLESRTLHAILDSIRQHRSSYMRLRVVKAGDPGEAAFLSLLVEDRIGSEPSYVEFLCQIHKTVHELVYNS